MAASGVAGKWLAPWIAVGGMVSALALFNALLLAYSRIPFVMATDRLLPRAIADARRARNAAEFACSCRRLLYSVFVLAPLGSLVVADALLYAFALSLEFAALIQLRKTRAGAARARFAFRSSGAV